jgi:hypothetical protein
MTKIYRFTAPAENWITGISIGKWAVSERNRQLWGRLEPGDIALFNAMRKSGYSKKTVASVVGYAVIASKKWVKDEPWWIQEKLGGQNQWPYVLTMDEVYLFSPNLAIDFETDMIDKSDTTIQHEVEALTASGIPITALNAMAQQIDAAVPQFPTNGTASTVNPIYEKLILDRVEGFYQYNGSSNQLMHDRLVQDIDETIAVTDKYHLREQATLFTAEQGSGYVTKQGAYVLRKDNETQKQRIAWLEDHTCQVCGFICEYTRGDGTTGWIYEVDHIIDKSLGGTEAMDNLWVLCPNCHRKKTRRVIKIDPERKLVLESGVPVRIRDNHLDW